MALYLTPDDKMAANILEPKLYIRYLVKAENIKTDYKTKQYSNFFLSIIFL